MPKTKRPKKSRVRASPSDTKHRVPSTSKSAGTPEMAVNAEPQPTRDVATRWGGHEILVREGYVPVVSLFLKLSGSLKPHPLTPAQALFVLQLMVHKWDAKHPYPAYKTIAQRMGVSVEYARSIARDLRRRATFAGSSAGEPRSSST